MADAEQPTITPDAATEDATKQTGQQATTEVVTQPVEDTGEESETDPAESTEELTDEEKAEAERLDKNPRFRQVIEEKNQNKAALEAANQRIADLESKVNQPDPWQPVLEKLQASGYSKPEEFLGELTQQELLAQEQQVRAQVQTQVDNYVIHQDAAEANVQALLTIKRATERELRSTLRDVAVEFPDADKEMVNFFAKRPEFRDRAPEVARAVAGHTNEVIGGIKKAHAAEIADLTAKFETEKQNAIKKAISDYQGTLTQKSKATPALNGSSSAAMPGKTADDYSKMSFTEAMEYDRRQKFGAKH